MSSPGSVSHSLLSGSHTSLDKHHAPWYTIRAWARQDEDVRVYVECMDSACVIFAACLLRYGGAIRVTSLLLLLSGVACLLIGVGVIAQLAQLVSVSSMVGGILALLGYAALGLGLLRGTPHPAGLRASSTIS